VRRFEQEFEDYVQRSHQGIFDAIRETGEMSDDTTTALKDAVEEFRRSFEVTGGELLVSTEDEEAADASSVGQDTIPRVVPKPSEQS
jgi:F-type H+/Na+-transporting ATPase subunit alpha